MVSGFLDDNALNALRAFSIFDNDPLHIINVIVNVKGRNCDRNDCLPYKKKEIEFAKTVRMAYSIF